MSEESLLMSEELRTYILNHELIVRHKLATLKMLESIPPDLKRIYLSSFENFINEYVRDLNNMNLLGTGSIGSFLGQPKEEEKTPIIGLANLGTTCWFNASIQALLNFRPFTEYLLQNQDILITRLTQLLEAPGNDEKLKIGGLINFINFVKHKEKVEEDARVTSLEAKEMDSHWNDVCLSVPSMLAEGSGRQQDANEFITSLLGLFRDYDRQNINSFFGFQTINLTQYGCDQLIPGMNSTQIEDQLRVELPMLSFLDPSFKLKLTDKLNDYFNEELGEKQNCLKIWLENNQFDVNKLSQILVDNGIDINNICSTGFFEQMEQWTKLLSDYYQERNMLTQQINATPPPENIEVLKEKRKQKGNQINNLQRDRDTLYDLCKKNLIMGATQFRRGTYLQSTPSCLIISIRRNDPNQRIQNEIEYPHVLDIQPYLEESKRAGAGVTKYDLISVVMHRGDSSPRSGHYFTYIKRDGQWYIANDSVIKAYITRWDKEAKEEKRVRLIEEKDIKDELSHRLTEEGIRYWGDLCYSLFYQRQMI